MDFIDKKEKLIKLLEEYKLDKSNNKDKLLAYINELSLDEDFKNKDLFKNIFNEFNSYLDELSQKELKQRILMIKGFLE